MELLKVRSVAFMVACLPQPRFAGCDVSPHLSQVFPSDRSPSRDRVHSTCLVGCQPARSQIALASRVGPAGRSFVPAQRVPVLLRARLRAAREPHTVSERANARVVSSAFASLEFFVGEME